MSLVRQFYPHAIVFNDSNPDVVQMSELAAAYNDRELSESCASGAAPEFLGIAFASPDVRFTTQQIASILDRLPAANSYLSESFAAGVVDLEYRAGKPFGTREAMDSGLHVIGRMTQSALLYWNGISARQGEVATITPIIQTVWNSGAASDPITWLASQDIVTECDVTELFSMGKFVINGSTLTGVTDVQWNNNVELAKIAADGDEYDTFCGIQMVRPEIMITCKKADLMATYGQRGAAVTSWIWYLRKYATSPMFAANGSAVHIKFSGSAGFVRCKEISGSPTDVQVSLRLKQFDSGGNEVFFEVDTTSAIT